ncbi:MAG: TetR/AcrR family transcriptional regulator [Proteobacteria bacterium]|nr:TetR/AcrR family transcriptional regulator [Pseudomonadota bacterium]
MTTKSSSTRALILSRAAFVFYEHGFHATGVERVARAAGVTKATLYHHFQNKDELMAESLRFLSKEFKARCFACWQSAHLSAQEKLVSLFDTFAHFFEDEACFGCPFINAAAEFSEHTHPIRKICADHFHFVREHLEGFARDAALRSPEQVARRILTIIMGTFCSWQSAQLPTAAQEGKELAQMVIASAA